MLQTSTFGQNESKFRRPVRKGKHGPKVQSKNQKNIKCMGVPNPPHKAKFNAALPTHCKA